MSKAQPGSGYGLTSSGYGFSLNTSEPFPKDSDAKILFLYPVLDGDKVSVTPGLINGYVPKIGSTHIDATTPPKITIEGAGYICAKATYEANKFFPRTATIVYEYGATTPADTNTDGYFALARVNVTSGVYSMTVLAYGNLIVNRLKAGNSTATWWWQGA